MHGCDLVGDNHIHVIVIMLQPFIDLWLQLLIQFCCMHLSIMVLVEGGAVTQLYHTIMLVNVLYGCAVYSRGLIGPQHVIIN